MLLTEKLKSVAADVKRIRESLTPVNPDGVRVGRESDEVLIRQRSSGEWEARVYECAMLIRDVLKGDKPSYLLKEAMTTSDFPLLFGDTLNRQLLGAYTAYPATYPAYFQIHDVPDFRSMKMLQIDGGGGSPLAAVAERASYPETVWTEAQTSLSVTKYGRRYGVSFEMMVQDDLNAFASRPQVMAEDARSSEEYLATSKVFDANGPHASFFTTGNGNIITANAVLGVAGLTTAYTIIGEMKDSANRPIFARNYVLVVPPALEVTANNLINSLEILAATGGGANTANDILRVANWIKNRLTVVVNPYIPQIVTNSTRGRTSWVLVAVGQARPAFHFGFLRGYRLPQLSMKTPNNTMLSGPSLGALDGDFDRDEIDYRVRHIFGASIGDVKMAVGSNGTGS